MKSKPNNKITQFLYEKRGVIFVVLAIIIINFFRGYLSTSSNHKQNGLDNKKFENVAKYLEEKHEDLGDSLEFSKDTSKKLDYESRNKDLELLNTDKIVASNNTEKEFMRIMDITKTFNKRDIEAQKKLTSATSLVDLNDLMNLKNLTSLSELQKMKKNLKVLHSAAEEYLESYKNNYNDIMISLDKEIHDKKLLEDFLIGARKAYDATTNANIITRETYRDWDKVVDFCMNAIKTSRVEYDPTEDTILFETDEQIDQFNKLTQIYNNDYMKAVDAQNTLLKLSKDSSESVKKSLK